MAGRSRPGERRHGVGEERAHRPRGGVKEDASFALRDREGRCEERRREPESRRSCVNVLSREREQREVLLAHGLDAGLPSPTSSGKNLFSVPGREGACWSSLGNQVGAVEA